MSFGSFNDDGDDSPMSEINVTPLVDVMLVLLIVFMITMPVLTHSVPLNLPIANKQGQADTKKNVKPMQISVNISGQYVVGANSTTPVDLDALRKEFEAIAKQDPDTIIAIAADKNVAYEHVANVLNSAREAGLSKVSFDMEAKSGK
ncbi:ExbD/TolR family protein [Kingella negevensis]|uniref:ExbD/TolR family protein n=1 Tax=Kingella negevensis TaxID=1522312 RepID=UPI00050A27B3|nr:biopolymer transporter ExbD [Kingella negevensis]MDK4687818.1 biopolymer transporter ExbD [Kingella negevensis]WII91186.1 biopolymer transporter ExbD [Kingella negevensis]